MLITCMIPARLGSQRLKRKNLQIIGNETLVSHAIKRAKKAQCFDKIIVNSESMEIREIAEENGVDFYERSKELANNLATSEDFIEDFLLNNECDYVVQLHTIAPLLSSEEIGEFCQYLRKERPDSLVSCENIQIEVAMNQKPINFSFEEKTNSQELTPVQRITWAIAAWKRDAFLSTKAQGKCATYNGKFRLYPISSLSSHVIKTQFDLEIARVINDYMIK